MFLACVQNWRLPKKKMAVEMKKPHIIFKKFIMQWFLTKIRTFKFGFCKVNWAQKFENKTINFHIVTYERNMIYCLWLVVRMWSNIGQQWWPCSSIFKLDAMIAYSLLDSINKIIKLTSWHVKYQTLALSIVRFQF